MLLKKPKINQTQNQIETAAWAQQVLARNQEKLLEVEGPAIVKVKNGVEVRIDAHNNVTIVGQNAFKFKCEGDMEFEADNITMKTKDTHRIVSEKHIVQRAARIDFNPGDESELVIPEEGLKYIKGYM